MNYKVTKMKCKCCDRDLPDRVSVCPFCGAAVEASQDENKPDNETNSLSGHEVNESLSQSGKTAEEGTVFRTKMAAAKQAGLGMKWYIFMIVMTIVTAGMFLSTAYHLFTGYYYVNILGNTPELFNKVSNLYQMYPALNYVDKFCGIMCVGIAILAGITAFRLIQFRRNAPGLLSLLCLADILFCLIRYVAEYGIFELFTLANILENALHFIPAVIALVVNMIYFGKREFLFDR